MCTIRVGCEHHELLAITLVGRSHPDARDYWDGNWVRTSVEVAASGFRGQVDGDLRADELAVFHRDLAQLVETLVGEARLSTMEDWLTIDTTGDGRGHIKLSCEVRDQPGLGNLLAFKLALDRTDVEPMVKLLGRALTAFPVLGKPEE